MDYRNEIYAKYASHFQVQASTFDLVASRRWGRPYRYYLRGWLPLEKDAAILDIACGSGKLLQFFKNCGYANIIGVDLSPQQAAIAKRIPAHVFEANILDFLKEKHECFDLVIGLDIIEHLTKAEALSLLKVTRTALRPGGRLVLQTPNADSPFAMSLRYGDLTHEICFNVDLLSKLLAFAGYQNIVARETGPIPRGGSVLSSFRYVVWQIIKLGIRIWNFAEVGGAGGKICTRVMLISAVKE